MFSTQNRREFLVAAGAAAAAACAGPARADAEFPKGPVRIIVPLTAGGAADVATRALALELESLWKKPVLVENKPGGLFQIGMQALQALPADGHTLLHLHNSLASVQAVHKAYDMNRQLAPVSLVFETPMVLLVSGNSPHRSLADLLKHLRAQAGKASYSSLGVGSVEHLKSEQLAALGDFKAMNVPYRAGPDMLKGLIGGEVDFTLTAAIFGKMYAPTGQVRVLAVIQDRRWDAMPEVPTIQEAGLDAPALQFWGGVAVRAGTPPELVRRLHADMATAAVAPSVAQRIANAGLSPVVSRSPEAFSKFIVDEVAWMGELAQTLGLRAQGG